MSLLDNPEITAMGMTMREKKPLNNVLMIVAVGKCGQIGLNGGLPWPHNLLDMAWFKQVTMDHVVVFGPKTADSVPPLTGRFVEIYQFDDDPMDYLDYLIRNYPGKSIFIAGGAATYKEFAGTWSRSLITHIDYDGPADTYLEHLW